MESGNANRGNGWGVRPLNWKGAASEEDSDSDVDMVSEDEQDVNLSISEAMEEKEFAKWVSMKWNLLEFDGTKPVSERKNEWERFSEQFARIVNVVVCTQRVLRRNYKRVG
ncbi:hypothetical protein ACFFRR_009723 [Megaselia abdita]